MEGEIHRGSFRSKSAESAVNQNDFELRTLEVNDCFFIGLTGLYNVKASKEF